MSRTDESNHLNPSEAFWVENQEAQIALKQLIGSGQAFAIVGAGSSKRCGYPLWNEFLAAFAEQSLTSIEKREVISRLTMSQPSQENISGSHFLTIQPSLLELATTNPLGFASAVQKATQERVPHRFRQYLKEIFGANSKPRKEHHRLVGLNFRGILTTNYDYILERCLDEVHGNIGEPTFARRTIDLSLHPDELARFIHPSEDAIKPCRRLILHLHGTYESPQFCIVTLEDYKRAYSEPDPGSSDSHITSSNGFNGRFLKALCAMQRLVFFGFSYSDPFFRLIIKDTSRAFWFDSKPIHFLVTGISQDTFSELITFRDELKGHGIQLVCFAEEAGSYEGFANAIAFLGETSLGEETRESSHAGMPAADENLAREYAKNDEVFL